MDYAVMDYEVARERRGIFAGEAVAGVRALLANIGITNPTGSVGDTPARVVRALLEMTSGYEADIGALLSRTFAVQHSGLVVLRDIRFASLCEHHLLPFTGIAHVAYIPHHERVVGVSKLARVVDAFARRLQVQERMTDQIVDALVEHLDPLGAAVTVRAQHQCMGCRGVRQPDAVMVTTALRGVLEEDPARAEALAQIR
jgi:GTP cyclohydrolase I